MPINECSYEQTGALRDALETVVHRTRDGEHRLEEIAKVILRIAKEITLDSVALANLALSEMTRPAQRI